MKPKFERPGADNNFSHEWEPSSRSVCFPQPSAARTRWTAQGRFSFPRYCTARL